MESDTGIRDVIYEETFQCGNGDQYAESEKENLDQYVEDVINQLFEILGPDVNDFEEKNKVALKKGLDDTERGLGREVNEEKVNRMIIDLLEKEGYLYVRRPISLSNRGNTHLYGLCSNDFIRDMEGVSVNKARNTF